MEDDVPPQVKKVDSKGRSSGRASVAEERETTSQRSADLLFVTHRGVAEAVDDNPRRLLALDHRVPGRIVAFVSPEIQREIARQMAKDPELDGVSIGASLSSLIDEVCDYIEDNDGIDRLMSTLSEAIERLKAVKGQRRAFLEATLCDRCGHPALQHFRPNVGEIGCDHSGCNCEAFESEVAPSPRLSPRRKVRVLLAEDRPDTSRLVRGFLNSRIYDVDIVEDGQSAVGAFTTRQYDVVLMDIGLPKLDGCAAIRRAREWERENGLRPTPIIALTSYVREAEIETCLAAGASLHIGKPVKRTTLLEFIRWTLRERNGTATDRATPLIVEIPADRSDPLIRFISDRKQAALRIKGLLAQGDFGSIRALANSLKQDREGGEPLDLVIELLRALEQAASRRNAGDVDSLTKLLTEYLDRLSVVCSEAGRKSA